MERYVFRVHHRILTQFGHALHSFFVQIRHPKVCSRSVVYYIFVGYYK